MTAALVERMTLDEVTKEIDEVSGTLSTAFREATDEHGVITTETIEILGDIDERAKSTRLAEMHDRLGELGKHRDGLVKLDEMKAGADAEQKWVNRPVGPLPPAMPQGDEGQGLKSLGELFVESKALTEFPGGHGTGLATEIGATPDLKALLGGPEQKTVMFTGTGWAPQNIRTTGATRAGREERYVQDFLPIIPTTQAAYVFMRQTTRTINAQEDAESVQGTLVSAQESALAYTEITETLRKIQHFIPVSDEQLSDVPGIAAEIDAEMMAGLRERLNTQIIAGDGTPPNIEGFLDAGRAPNTVAKGANDVFTAIHDGMRVNRVTGQAGVDLIILHDNDWHSIRTTQTTEGVFILGPPSIADNLQLWGVPVLVTTAETENTALLGDFARFARVIIKGGIEMQISSEHASFFIQGVQAIKASMRVTLANLREDAFTTVTGI